jgi:uncharacterized protein YyaL (SSP411 family)
VRELKDPAGGYYAAIDADSEGVEGMFYVWDKAEVEAILDADSGWYSAFYNITEHGNWEEKNILNVTASTSTFSKEIGKLEDEFIEMLEAANEKMLNARSKRIRPITDDKILLGWNGLFLTALCRSFATLQVEAYREAAVELFDFLYVKFRNAESGGLFHTYKNGDAKQAAFLDDYAFFIQGCIQLQEITGNQEYLRVAKTLTQYVEKNFTSPGSAQFYFTEAGQDDIVVRKMEFYDSAIPSGNAVMATNLAYLAIVFDEKDWKSRATDMISSLKDTILKYPSSFSVWAMALQQQFKGIHEIAITGKDVEQLLEEILVQYIPNKILQSGTEPVKMPILEGKSFLTTSLAYLCKDYQCFEPVKTGSELMARINN